MARDEYSHGIYTALGASGERVDIEEAVRQGEYRCELCGARLIPKKGDVRIHHFAHEKGHKCDPWAQRMSEWHREWQERFPPESRERVVKHGGSSHRADVLLEAPGTVVEFQHSPLSSQDFHERNDFYAAGVGNVIWLFDVSKAYHDERVECGLRPYEIRQAPAADPPETWLTWKYANKALQGTTAHDLDRQRVRVFLQLGDPSHGIARPIAEVTESDEGFRSCDVRLLTVDEFVGIAHEKREYETVPVTDFQKGFLNRHPDGYAAMVKKGPFSSTVVLRKGKDRRLIAVADLDENSIAAVLDRAPGLREHYDEIDIVVDISGWTKNGILTVEPIGCKGYSGDYFCGDENPELVLKVKEKCLGRFELPQAIGKAIGEGGRAKGGPEVKLWACVDFSHKVPTSLTWTPDGTRDELCWPFAACR